MNISKEVRIGILVTAALVVFFSGFYFLKGADLFSNDREYISYYPDVEGLVKSTTVQINGVVVGRVSGIQLAGERGVKLTLAVNKKIDLPQGSVSSIESPELLTAKIIKIIPGKGPGILSAGAELPASVDIGLMDKISGELSPRLAELKVTISSFNKTLDNVNAVLGADNQKAITAAISSLQGTAHNLQILTNTISGESGEIKDVIHNANSVTANLAKNNDTIQRIFANVSNISRQFANAPIQKTLTELHNASASLQSVMDKINNSQGSLGMLINNKDVYNNLNSTLKSLNSLTDDLKAHPSRYINVSVFGSKKKN